MPLMVTVFWCHKIYLTLFYTCNLVFKVFLCTFALLITKDGFKLYNFIYNEKVFIFIAHYTYECCKCECTRQG